ncbi:FAD-dependent oxidoreductase [Phototrophicus methaneseepsis]|nr:FAD-dependent oxidoreductase [Phototrophicus methaneseepsis]
MLNTIHRQVVVVGAGAAGLTAAISAARNGAETLLIEYQGYLGGISSTLAWIGFHDQDYRQVVKGLPYEFIQRMWAAGQASPFELDIKCSSIISINNHYWKILAMQMVQEAGVQLMLHTQVVETLREGDRITGVIVEHKSGRQKITADVVIDCTGDGDVAARGGVAWEKGRTADGLVQAPTLVFRLGGLDRSEFIEGCKDPEINYREWIHPYPDLWEKTMKRIDQMQVIITGGFAGLMEKARLAGDYDVPQTRLVGVKTHQPDQFLVVSTRVLGLDPTSVESMTDAYTRLYQQVPDLMRFFKNWMPGGKETYLMEIAPMMGVRESRRIMGDYVLSANDIVNGREFDDVIALGGYHIDIHRPSGTWVDSKNVQTYDIPYRCLIAGDVEGLMMAGKCLSATHEGVASTRVIPICMAQGQAVGTAAALAVKAKKSPRDIDIRQLQNTLIDQGAELRQTLGGPDYEAIERIGQLPKDEPPTTGDADQASQTAQAWIK